MRAEAEPPALEKYPDIHEAFLLLLKEHTAGDPMDEKVKWTDLTNTEIAELKARYQAEGSPVVSVDTKKKEVLCEIQWVMRNYSHEQ